MAKPPGPHGMYLAPSASVGARAIHCPGDPAGARHLPGGDRAWPRVDDHVVEPETGTEMIDGIIVEVSPAGRAHGVTQATLARLLGALVTDAYEVATEMLTRTSERWNFAADVSVLRRGEDPVTGGRYLEEVVFEVRDSQRPGELERRARQLSDRGVRRIFAIRARLEHPDRDFSAILVGPIEEWSASERRFEALTPGTEITDPTLCRPIKAQAFLDAAEASCEMARALLAQRNRVLVEHERAVKAEGKREGLLEAVASACDVLGIELSAERRAHLESLDDRSLAALHGRLLTRRSWTD